MMIQWLRISMSTAGGMGLTHGLGNWDATCRWVWPKQTNKQKKYLKYQYYQLYFNNILSGLIIKKK